MSSALRQAARTLLAAIGVAFIFAFVVAVVLASPAQAASAVNCLPLTKHTPAVTSGSKLRTAKSDTGRWVAWWCGGPDPANPTTRWLWRQQTYAVLAQYSAPLEAAIDAAGGDAETFAALSIVVNLPQISPPTGSQAEYEFKMLKWSACKALVTKPYDIALQPDPPADFCKDAPTPPPINTGIWKAIGGTIFTYANGKLTGVTSRKAAKDAPAVCVPSMAVVGTRIFCQLVGGPLNEVAEAVK